jgi:transmembrane sensor
MQFSDQVREEAANWFAAVRRGPMSLEERQAYDSWRADPIHQAALNAMHELWGEMAGLEQLGAELPRQHRPRSRWFAMAAGVVAMIGAGGLYLVNSDMEARSRPDQVATVVGEQRTATMGDGSLISLNVATSLALDETANRRTVDMQQGEAAFFVHKDKSRPFTVRVGNYEVLAVGTAFNIRNRGGRVEVAVIEGIVSIRAMAGPRAGDRIALLRAGKKVALGDPVQLAAGQVVPASVEPSSIAEWRMRTLDYEDVPISRVVEDLNLFFDRPVGVEDSSVGSRRVTIRLQVEDRERALSTLAGLLDLELRRSPARDILAPAGASGGG